MKLIPIEEGHYIIVDDSEILEGDFFYDFETKSVKRGNRDVEGYKDYSFVFRKITHSTKPLLCDEDGSYYPMNVIAISVEEVEEAIYVYDVERMAMVKLNNADDAIIFGYTEGFKAQKELTKDKLFTVEDMFGFAKEYSDYITKCNNSEVINPSTPNEYFENPFNIKKRKFTKQSLLPKTEWEVEFDENGKLKLK